MRLRNVAGRIADSLSDSLDDGPTDLWSPEISLRAQESRGFELAGLGRILIAVAFALYAPFAYPAGSLPPLIVVCFGFILFSAAQIAVSRHRWFLEWGKFLFILFDVAVIVALLVFRNPLNESQWSIQQGFRLEIQLVLFAYLGSIALTNSPRVVLAAGVLSALIWTIVTLIVASLPDTLTWRSLPSGATMTEALAHYLQPNFFDTAARLLEIVVMVVLATLLATAAHRGRTVFRRYAEAVRRQHAVQDAFGKYVPDPIARQLSEQGGVVIPERRIATILFCDIESFTSICEVRDPSSVLDMLNDYFDSVGEAINTNGGTITQLQGDALLATFNLPDYDSNHAVNAVQAGQQILEVIREREFAGMKVNVRIGIATGPVIAGSCGGRARMSYTVHGDTVNIAARLEALNKRYDTRLLICPNSAELIGSQLRLSKVDSTTIRGKRDTIDIYTTE